jgi:hypothetical protein
VPGQSDPAQSSAAEGSCDATRQAPCCGAGTQHRELHDAAGNNWTHPNMEHGCAWLDSGLPEVSAMNLQPRQTADRHPLLQTGTRCFVGPADSTAAACCCTQAIKQLEEERAATGQQPADTAQQIPRVRLQLALVVSAVLLGGWDGCKGSRTSQLLHWCAHWQLLNSAGCAARCMHTEYLLAVFAA